MGNKVGCECIRTHKDEYTDTLPVPKRLESCQNAMKNDITRRIMADITVKYESLNSPHYSFVMKAINAQPYEQLKSDVEAFASVEDLTDPNYEVCFHYLIYSAGEAFSLNLSMIGPYAVLTEIEPSEKCRLITKGKQALSGLERRLRAILRRHSIALLDEEILSTPVNIRLSDSDSKEATIAQALFGEDFQIS